jgi:hypothetical protein
MCFVLFLFVTCFGWNFNAAAAAAAAALGERVWLLLQLLLL